MQYDTDYATFKRGDIVRYRDGVMNGEIVRVFPHGIGAGDPGPSFRVAWENGSESKVTRRNLVRVTGVEARDDDEAPPRRRGESAAEWTGRVLGDRRDV